MNVATCNESCGVLCMKKAAQVPVYKDDTRMWDVHTDYNILAVISTSNYDSLAQLGVSLL